MAQTILIGLGGTGSRVVNNVVKELRLRGRGINDGNTCCVVLDTNVNDNALIDDSMTGVPVIGTSTSMRIGDYKKKYAHLDMNSWCPDSPSYNAETMIDGASEMRTKSRIAFMDCVESGKLNDKLGWMLNDVLKGGYDSKIKVMIVSSLSGGTGSGMFIQTALWIRRELANRPISIQGMFLLPDVFVSTVKDIRESARTRHRHYCNAYAAVRDLNAISKIMKNGDSGMSDPITVDRLFDSVKDARTGKQVYDFAFFVDDKDVNGVRISSIAEYEKLVAQMVYSQVYSPMSNNINSELDNLFAASSESEEPLYGTCGSAKACYPVESVKEYCVLRATQDSLTKGWKKIDEEIAALVEEKKQREKDGVFSEEVLDPRAKYISIYEQKVAVKPEEAGRDRFFLTISKDSKNEEKVTGENGNTTVKYTDKVSDFISAIKQEKVDVWVTRKSGTDEVRISDVEQFVKADHSEQELLERYKSDNAQLEEAIEKFEKGVDSYADAIVDSIFPYSMGDVKPHNRCTIYGLLSKMDHQGNYVFAHPVAVRYMLYKLVGKLNGQLKQMNPSDLKATAMQVESDLLDNKATKKVTEVGMEELLRGVNFFNRDKFIDTVEKQYSEYINTRADECAAYEQALLLVAVFKKLIVRLELLIKQLESFFKGLDGVQENLDIRLANNLADTSVSADSIIYVFGSKEAKESLYGSLSLDINRGTAEINKCIVDTIYGKVCAEKRPSNTDNAAYANTSATATFLQRTLDSFAGRIEDKDNKAELEMNIYQAICKESDFASKTNGADLGMSGESTLHRHRTAFVDCYTRLRNAAAPFLKTEIETPDNRLGQVISREKTFWGFSADVVESCPYIGEVLGVNPSTLAGADYPSNELSCFRMLVGLSLTYIPKFNEYSPVSYYKSYKEIVDAMIRDAAGPRGEKALEITPHLDKRWHRILPFVTPQKQRESEMQFFHAFWLALAYETVQLDTEGNFAIKRTVSGGYGNSIEELETLKYNGKPLAKTDISKLVKILREDMVFVGKDMPALEKKYEEEIDNLTSYVGTAVLKGLMTKKDELNAVNVVLRYSEGRDRTVQTLAALVDALSKIAEEIASKYNADRSAEKLEKAKYEICKKLYDSTARTKGKAEVFSSWSSAFKQYGIKNETV